MKNIAELCKDFPSRLTCLLDGYSVEQPGSCSCRARAGGHPVEPANGLWIPACARMTRVQSKNASTFQLIKKKLIPELQGMGFLFFACLPA